VSSKVLTSSRGLGDGYPNVVGMTMVVSVAVRVRVQWRRPPNLLLVPGERDPVDAAVAVHARLTLDRLVMPLEHQPGESGVGTEVCAVPDGDIRVLGGPYVGLRVDAVDQDPREQEVRHDRDRRRAEAAATFERLGDRRRRERDERGLDEPEAAR